MILSKMVAIFSGLPAPYAYRQIMANWHDFVTQTDDVLFPIRSYAAE